jgi:hypothetical protein
VACASWSSYCESGDHAPCSWVAGPELAVQQALLFKGLSLHAVQLSRLLLSCACSRFEFRAAVQGYSYSWCRQAIERSSARSPLSILVCGFERARVSGCAA